jgi:hypothetical protein
VIDLGVPSKFTQPSIELLNLRIDEPITTITDILLGIICLYAYFRIGRLKDVGNIFSYFRAYFLVLGLGAIAGGLLGHAFQYFLADAWKLVSWTLTMVSVALLVQALLGIAATFMKKGIMMTVTLLNLMGLLLAIFLTYRSIAFNPVKYYTIFGLVLLSGSLSVLIYRRTGNRAVLVLMGGVGIGFLSAIIFSLQWGLSHWFNHRDVSHIILCFSVYFVYKGVAMHLNSVISSR